MSDDRTAKFYSMRTLSLRYGPPNFILTPVPTLFSTLAFSCSELYPGTIHPRFNQNPTPISKLNSCPDSYTSPDLVTHTDTDTETDTESDAYITRMLTLTSTPLSVFPLGCSVYAGRRGCKRAPCPRLSMTGRRGCEVDAMWHPAHDSPTTGHHSSSRT